MLYNHPDNVLVNQKASLLPAIIIVAAVVCLMFLYKLYLCIHLVFAMKSS